VRVTIWIALALLLSACPGSGDIAPSAPSSRSSEPVTISVVATTDLHGHLGALPILGGYVENLRQALAGRGGVVLVDAGDIYQGTLASNLNQGAAAIAAYSAIGYDAAAIGNHEFDFGPEGPAPTPQSPEDDPRGALKARATEASFPMLAANLAVEGGGRVDWENVPATALVDVEGVRIGIIGVTTVATPHTTIATNFEGLEVWPLVPTVRHQARELRAQGAAVVVVAGHVGGRCAEFDDPDDLSSCELHHEVFELARELPAGLVDVIAAGHTHSGVAHRKNGIAIVQAYANGAGFGRVDLQVRPDTGDVLGVEIHPPQVMCRDDEGAPRPANECDEHAYAGAAVTPNDEVAAIVAEAEAIAEELRSRSLGVVLEEPVTRSYAAESALGNLFADLMREAVPGADIAITNGGGLRADLPAGELTYGVLHTATPFDNQFSLVTLRGEHLIAALRRNLGQSSGIWVLSGATAEARCEDGKLEIQLRRPDGTPIAEDEELLVATSDFLAPGGGRGAFGRLGLPAESVRVGEGGIIRDAMATLLAERGGMLSPADYFEPDRPRLVYPGRRPVQCEDG
jgi:2',3'-cyclic-nucleotide 2'-phosphodiesterase (5'-nucleotidase family)